MIEAMVQNSAGTLMEFQLDDGAGGSALNKVWTLATELSTGYECNASDKPHFETLRRLDTSAQELIWTRGSLRHNFILLSALLGKSTRTLEAIRIRRLPPLQRYRGMQDLIAILSEFVSLEPESLQSICLSELEDWDDNFFILEQLLNGLRRIYEERGVYLHENKKPGTELKCNACTEWRPDDCEELHTRPVIPPNPFEGHDDEVCLPDVPIVEGGPPEALPKTIDVSRQLVHFAPSCVRFQPSNSTVCRLGQITPRTSRGSKCLTS